MKKEGTEMRRWISLFLALLLMALTPALAESADEPAEEAYPAREAFIDRIIETGHQLFIKANGKLQRAHYAGDIYVCKNFTVHVFRENCDDFRMAEYPDTPLTIPNNLPAADCKPYSYGYCWEEISPEDGNPFYIGKKSISFSNYPIAAGKTFTSEFFVSVSDYDAANWAKLAKIVIMDKESEAFKQAEEQVKALKDAFRN